MSNSRSNVALGNETESPSLNRDAVKELFSVATESDYIEMIDEFWETWITSPGSDGTTSEERSRFFYRTAQLKKLISSI